MYTSVISVEARQDIASAVLYYQRISEDLKSKFLAALEKRLDDIGHFPQAYGFRHGQIRAANVKKFRYLIYFIVEEDTQTVKIFAVLHGSQNPTTWIDRLV